MISIDGRKFYELIEFFGIFNIVYIEITSCAGVVDISLGSLVLHSSLSSFEIVLSVRDGEQYLVKGVEGDPDEWKTSVGDKWELRDDTGNPIPRGNIYGPEKFSGESYYSLQIDKDTSSRIIHSGVKKLDFLLLQRWTEVDPNNGGRRKSEEYGDRVWLMALFPNSDGKAERAGILTMPYENWLAASPRVSTICLV
jgi:hypothetical protein